MSNIHLHRHRTIFWSELHSKRMMRSQLFHRERNMSYHILPVLPTADNQITWKVRNAKNQLANFFQKLCTAKNGLITSHNFWKIPVSWIYCHILPKDAYLSRSGQSQQLSKCHFLSSNPEFRTSQENFHHWQGYRRVVCEGGQTDGLLFCEPWPLTAVPQQYNLRERVGSSVRVDGRDLMSDGSRSDHISH